MDTGNDGGSSVDGVGVLRGKVRTGGGNRTRCTKAKRGDVDGRGQKYVEASSYLPVGSRPFLEIPDSVLYGSQFGVLFVYEMITPL